MLGSISTRVAAAALVLAATAVASPQGAGASQSQPIQLAQAAATQAPQAKGAAVTPVDRVERYIARLHRQLKITDAQAAQWNAVADVMRANAQMTDTLTRQRAANAKTMTAVDNLHSYQQYTQAHADGLQKLVTAFDALYATMSDEQKKNADAVFRNVGRGHHRGRPAKQQG